MNKVNVYSLAAVLSGAMLALMIDVNSQLAAHTSAFEASWIAHGIGMLMAFVLLQFNRKKTSSADSTTVIKQDTYSNNRKVYYLGGIPGAFTVVLASISVQSSVGLAGTLALGLVGQLAFSLLAEHIGLFQLKRNRISLGSVLPVICVACGATLIIFGRI